MWDLALAFFIVRIAFIYFILTYLSSLFLSFIRLNQIIPYNHLTAPARELIAFPIYILTVALWARTVIVYYEIPRVAGFRIAVGLVAGSFMVIAELVGGFILWEEGYKEWIWETDVLGAGLKGSLLMSMGKSQSKVPCQRSGRWRKQQSKTKKQIDMVWYMDFGGHNGT
ncbi:hypothetical protein EYC84_011224 [Monilinia fructicola]|uniref:Uncharacterized protein n=1 Tax=Monilinia fructicola TaxID=38448 RepID=A0A5M9J713_MONFR|nr:hypothetical protein EYC84_011224 [Monilinia fructicola]